ncbi:hypothetical protein JRI60_43915 [Archangium violaceum]|uniref:hypothetical protein n=1 Tax=Archangium violaceum TaxID=83451 RepID=UPI00194FBC05|nr:hypothetical protein [Archangium violaceum]QRN95919.1 hypothetical protein JRI60_43915 [Archangium violaceum]
MRSEEKFGDILSSLDKGLAVDSEGDLEAMNDLLGPAFDGVRSRQDFAKAVRQLIADVPDSDQAAAYRNLLRSLGETP